MRKLPLLLAFFILHLTAGAVTVSVLDHGATGDGKTLDTDAINAAIAAVADAGGGVVTFPAGEYLSYSIHLRSHVELHLETGSVIIAADPPPAGEPGGYDAPEPNPTPQYQDFGHSHWHNSLIWGEDLVDVAITGRGMIYGKGLSRGRGRVALPVNVTAPPLPGEEAPDVLMADGVREFEPRPDLVPGPFGYPNAQDALPAGVGNKAIALKNCRNVLLRDFTILHGGHFCILATGVDNLTIDNLSIDTNRDGMDIDACSNVRISNCTVNSPWDDGICLKSSHGLGYARVTENVTITNCFVSGYDEGTLLDGTRTRETVHRGGPLGRIKFGTEAGGGFRNITVSNCVFDFCRGLALEQVDGGVLEDVAVTNITMRDVPNAPIFIRLGARLRKPDTSEPGHARRILIDNVVAWNVTSEAGIFIAGVPGHPVEDVVLSNLQIHFAGGGTAADAAREVPEMEKGYPEPGLWGTLSSWGLFARHVTNLRMFNSELRVAQPDARPAMHLEEVQGAHFVSVELSGPGVAEADKLWELRDASGLGGRDTTALPKAE